MPAPLAEAMEFELVRAPVGGVRLNSGELIVPEGFGILYAFGSIYKNADKKLEDFLKKNSLAKGSLLVLHSQDGDFVEASNMGMTIRNSGFNTIVARRNPLSGASRSGVDSVVSFSRGECFGPCVLLLLGGVYRFDSSSLNSVIGMRHQRRQSHDFSGFVLDTTLKAMMYEHLGGSLELLGLELDAEKVSSKIRIFTLDEQVELGLIHPKDQAKWEIQLEEEGPEVVAYLRLPFEIQRLSFGCDGSGYKLELNLEALEKIDLVKASFGELMLLDESKVDLTDHLKSESIGSSLEITRVFSVPRKVMFEISSTKVIGFTSQDKSKELFLANPIRFSLSAAQRNLIRRLIVFCESSHRNKGKAAL